MGCFKLSSRVVCVVLQQGCMILLGLSDELMREKGPCIGVVVCPFTSGAANQGSGHCLTCRPNHPRHLYIFNGIMSDWESYQAQMWVVITLLLHNKIAPFSPRCVALLDLLLWLPDILPCQILSDIFTLKSFNVWSSFFMATQTSISFILSHLTPAT